MAYAATAPLMQPQAAPDEDPTVDFARRFADPSLWKIRKRIPIFAERTEEDPETGETEVLDPNELAVYVRNCNQLVATGNPPGLTLGHTRDDAPESSQPITIGYAKNFRMERSPLTGLMTVYHDEWYYPTAAAEVKSYPYRSVERWKVSKLFKPIALLRREPQINLGVVSYHAGEKVVRYSRESYMPDQPTQPPAHQMVTPNPEGGQAGPDADDLSPEEAQLADKFFRHYSMTNPVMKYMCAKYEAEAAAPDPAAAAAPAAGNTFVPGQEPAPAPAPVEQDARRMSANTNDLTRYQKENEALKQRVVALEKAERIARYNAELTVLREQGYVFEVSEELADSQNLDRNAFDKHKEKIKKNYHRAPVGGDFIRTPSVEPKKNYSKDQVARAVRMVDESNGKLSYDEALAKVG